MFEEKKTKTGRSFAIKVFGDLPWVVRAYFSLLIIFILTIAGMGIADANMATPVFKDVIAKMLGFSELIVGACIGALSAAADRKFSK